MQPMDAGVGWNDPSAIPPNSAYMRQAAGVVVNERTALQLSAVWACVRLLSQTLSCLPLHSYRRIDGVRVEVPNPPSLVADPFPGLEIHEGLAQGLVSYLLRGNAYYHVLDRDRVLGTPTSLDPIHPDNVKIDMRAGRISYEINRRPVPTADVLHIRGMTLPGAAVGLSPVQYEAITIGIGLAADEYGSRFFSQGAHPDAVLQTDQTLSRDAAKTLAQDIQTAHGGLSQSHLPLVLEGGLKWQPISIPPEEAQFLATKGYQKSDIAMIYGVPPHLIGDTDKSTSWGRGIEEQTLGFLNFTLRPLMVAWEASWSRQLPRGQFARFNAKELLRTNVLARYQSYILARTGGWLNNDEIRADEDEEPIPDGSGQDYAAPLNSNVSVANESMRPGMGSQDDIAT
jgi:HK97 family phage portal protein